MSRRHLAAVLPLLVAAAIASAWMVLCTLQERIVPPVGVKVP